MLIKITILNNLRTIILSLLLVCYVQLMYAQANDTLPADSISVIKQLLKEKFTQQLQSYNTTKKNEQIHLKALLNNSTVTDSLSKLILQQMQQLKNTVVNTGKSITTGVLYAPKQILQQQFAKCMQLQDIKGLIDQFTGMIKQPLLQWKGGTINIGGQTSPSLLNDGNVFVNNAMLNGGWSVMGVPMGMQFARQDFNGPEYYSRSTFSFVFDRDAYLKSIRDKIKLKIKASDLVPDYNDALQKMKEAAMGKLKSTLDSINVNYKGELSKQLEKLGNTEDMLKTAITVLQDKLLSAGFLQNIEEKKNLLQQMQQTLHTGGEIDMNVYDSLLQTVQSVAGTNEIINKIKLFKDDIQKNGLIDKLQQAAQLKNNNMQQLLQDPDKLKSLAKEQLDLNGMQKLFLNMNQLKVGMNTVNLSPLTLYQYVNNGMNASFVNNKTYVFIMAGKQKDLNNLFDNHFSAPLFPVANTAMGLSIGKGDMAENHTHVSLFTYKQSNSGYNSVINAVPGSTTVATFSNQLKIDKANYLEVEISKSAHKYNNQQNVYDSLLQGNALSKQLLNSGNFIQQMAFTLQWHGALKENSLLYDLQASSIGKSYNNPGSQFISSGTAAFGGGIKKGFLQNKLQFSAKGNYKKYAYSNNNMRWRNYNFSFQAKWKFKQGQSVSLGYQSYQSHRLQDDIKFNMGASSRLSLDGNFRKRFGRVNYQHTISLSAVRNNYPFDSIPANNKSVLVSSIQTFIINKRSYFLNMQYTMAGQSSVLWLFTTQLNADAGCMYNICKRMTGSTAINYNSTKGWFQQTGIKQSLSGQLGERFIVSMYACIVKNIKEYRLNNMGSTRIDWSLQYLLK